jgi:hypothetical protein
MDYDLLRTAVRAMAGIKSYRDTLKAVSPVAMRRVCIDRGWTLEQTQPVCGNPDVIAFEVYEHPTAHGVNRRKGWGECVKVPMQQTYVDYFSCVADWAEAVASRHGDVAPAEILAEAFEAGRL